jgi:hypothetical protein
MGELIRPLSATARIHTHQIDGNVLAFRCHYRSGEMVALHPIQRAERRGCDSTETSGGLLGTNDVDGDVPKRTRAFGLPGYSVRPSRSSHPGLLQLPTWIFLIFKTITGRVDTHCISGGSGLHGSRLDVRLGQATQRWLT